MVVDGSTDTEGIEIASFSTLHAESIVPFGTERVVSSVEGVRVDDAGSLLNDVSVIAGQTDSSVGIPGMAKVADFIANSIVHVPSSRTLLADVMIPFGASAVDFGLLAGVFDNMVALIALETDSFCEVELRAEGRCLAADSFFVEVKAFGTFSTLVFDPGFAAIVIGDGDDIVKSNVSICWEETVEVSVESVVGEVGFD